MEGSRERKNALGPNLRFDKAPTFVPLQGKHLSLITCFCISTKRDLFGSASHKGVDGLH